MSRDARMMVKSTCKVIDWSDDLKFQWHLLQVQLNLDEAVRNNGIVGAVSGGRGGEVIVHHSLIGYDDNFAFI